MCRFGCLDLVGWWGSVVELHVGRVWCVEKVFCGLGSIGQSEWLDGMSSLGEKPN